MKFIIYSKSGCPYCDKIKKVMNLANLDHSVLNLGTDFDKQEFYDIFGDGSTFPQVIYNGENLGGCTETVKYIKENNLF